ncbi:MAG: ABC transporter substrate-binding protein [Chloroflexi bacterium]|nr:ABC transporter substrate-binding protein [Chloroflexota bacterium]
MIQAARRAALGVVALALAAAACTGDDAPATSLPATGTADRTATATPSAASKPAPTPTAEATATASPAATAAPTPARTSTPEPTPTEQPVEDSPELPVTVTDADGDEIVIEDVSRLVVLNGSITEIVFALGLGDHVVGADITSIYPPEAQDLPKVGVQIALSAEGVIALQPTLVIGTTFAGPPEVIEQIRGTGIPVLIIPDYNTLEAIEEKITRIGSALGVPRRGERLASDSVASIEEAIAAGERSDAVPRVAFLYLRGAHTQLIGGDGAGATSLIEAAGGIDVGVEAGVRGFTAITPEALVTANPDVFLVITTGLESVGGIDGLLEIPGMAQTTAGRNRAVVDFDAQYLLGFGPRSGAALAELIDAIHP